MTRTTTRLGTAVTAALLAATALVAVAGTPAQAAPGDRKVHVNGAATTVAVTAPGADAAVVFTGVAGQRVTVTTSGGTFARACDVRVSLRSGAGAELAAPVCAGTGGALPETALPVASNAYTVVLDVADGATGSLAVRVTGPGPRTITPGAGRLTLTVPAATTVDLGFVSPAGFRAAAFTTWPVDQGDPCLYRAELVEPSGAPVTSACRLQRVVDVPVSRIVTTAGLQHLRLVNTSDADVTATATVDITTDLVTALEPGVASTVTTAGDGQHAVFTVDLPAGTPLQLAVRGSGCGTQFQVFDPAGRLVEESRLVLCSFDDAYAAPASTTAGTWRVVVTPNRKRPLTFQITATGVPDVTGTVTDGSTTTTTLATKGQVARYTFDARAGQRATFDARSTAWSGPRKAYDDDLTVSAVGPSGQVVVLGSTRARPFALVRWGEAVLDETGPWTLVLDPYSKTTGTVTWTFGLVDDVTATVPTGVPTRVRTTAPGQRLDLPVEAVAGQTLTVTLTDLTFRRAGALPNQGQGRVELVGPDGVEAGQLARWNHGSRTRVTVTAAQVLDRTGTWTVRIDPAEAKVGSFTALIGVG